MKKEEVLRLLPFLLLYKLKFIGGERAPAGPPFEKGGRKLLQNG